MARLWQSGWETNSIATDVEWSNVTGAGATIQTTVTRTGGYAARTNPTAATAFFRYHYSTSNLSTVVYLRVYMRVAALPGGNTTVVRFVDSANNQCAQIRLTATGTLVLLDAASNPVGSASAALNLNQWYRIELGLDASTSPGSVEGRVDGATFASGANSAQAPWARILFGPVVTATCDIYWDDAALNDNTGPLQNTWPGEGKILHLLPSAAGDANAWNNTSNGAGSTSNWQLVSDNPPDDATTLVQSGTLNAEDLYNLTNTGIGAGDTVNAVMVGLRLRNNTADATTAVKAELKKTTTGTIAQGTAVIPNSTSFATNAPAQPRNYTLISVTDPDGAAWTQATLDSAQAGVKITAAGTNRIQVSALWVSVDYTPGTGTGASLTDTAAASDMATATATVAASDAAAGTDTVAASAAATVTDAAAANDALAVQAAAGIADSCHADDATAAAAAVPLGETARADDALTIARPVSLTDSAAAEDLATTSATVLVSDQGTAVDDAATASLIGLAEGATGVDDLAQGSPLVLADTAISGDGIISTTQVGLGDAAAAAEAITYAAASILAEAATATEGLTVAVLLQTADNAAVDDTVTVPQAVVPGVLAVTASTARHDVTVAGSITAAAAPASTLEVTAT